MSDERFAAPKVPDAPPLQVALPEKDPGTLADRKQRRRARRPRKTFHRPLNTPLIIWFFAFIGAGCLFWLFSDGLKGLSKVRLSGSDVSQAVRRPTVWKPVQEGEAVLIQLHLSPADARVLVDGAPASSNPVRLPRSPKRHQFVVMAPGFHEQTFEVSAAKPAQHRITLKKSK